MNFINDKKDLIGKRIELDNKLLFNFSSFLFNKEITIVDMEMNGKTGIKSEIIEFFGIKVKSGIIIDSFSFTCKHTKYDIAKSVIDKNILKIDKKEYESRKTIDYYLEDFINFLSGSTLFLWGSFYDRNCLINLLKKFDKREVLKTISYIDFQYCLKISNSQIFKQDLALSQLFNNSIMYKEENEENDNSIEFYLNMKNLTSHTALSDVWKLVFITLEFGDLIGEIWWPKYIKNIRFNVNKDNKKFHFFEKYLKSSN